MTESSLPLTSASMNSGFPLNFAYALGEPSFTGVLKSANEDFRVQEILDIEFSEQGEHEYLLIGKNGENSQWLADQIAQYAGVERVAIGFAGLKDRNAITQQWFSVHLPGAQPVDWSGFNSDTWTILAQHRHTQKLRRGQHQGNRFDIVIRQIPDTAKNEVEDRLQVIAEQGVPNYFGPQRFGHNGGNLDQADRWFQTRKAPRKKANKGMVLSAARAYIFNRILSERVARKSWRTMIDGDVPAESFPTGAMWGRGRLETSGEAELLENQVAAWPENWANQLEHQGLKQERRALVLLPQDLDWQWLDDGLRLHFALAPGQFATAVIRELVNS